MSKSFQEAVLQRYREAVPGLGATTTETLAIMLAHRSVRSFSKRPLPAGTLELLVAAAQSASTSSNKQLWSVVAVEGAARKERLAALCDGQAMIAAAPLFLVFLADHSRIRSVAAARGRPVEGLDYVESFLAAVLDASLAAQNAAVAAESLGLGMVYVGAARSRPEAMATELGLPPACFAVVGMCVGYAHEQLVTAVKPRLPQAAVLHREQYSAAEAVPAIERHDGYSLAFRQEQNQEPMTWTEHVLPRLRDAQSLKGRSRLLESLRRLGFPMK
jgi:nitroreductase